MKIIYSNTDGRIITAIPNDMDYQKMFCEFDKIFVNDLSEILADNFSIENVYTHKVENEKIISYSDLELFEVTRYGRVLLEDERLLEKFKPSNEEIRKAEITIETLSLLSEVL